MKIQCLDCQKFYDDKLIIVKTLDCINGVNWSPYCKICFKKRGEENAGLKRLFK